MWEIVVAWQTVSEIFIPHPHTHYSTNSSRLPLCKRERGHARKLDILLGLKIILIDLMESISYQKAKSIHKDQYRLENQMLAKAVARINMICFHKPVLFH